MKLKYEIATEWGGMVSVEKTTRKSDMVFLTDSRDGECVGFEVEKIDEVIAALLKLKGIK